MYLILLFGGSGKRLCPLSNGARGKLFLPVMKVTDGGTCLAVMSTAAGSE